MQMRDDFQFSLNLPLTAETFGNLSIVSLGDATTWHHVPQPSFTTWNLEKTLVNYEKKETGKAIVNWVKISILSEVLLAPFSLFREGINSRSRWLTLTNRPSLIIQFVRKSVFNRQYLLQKHQTIQSSHRELYPKAGAEKWN